MNRSGDNGLLVRFPNPIYFMLIRLQLCYHLCGPLIVSVLCALLAIDVALSSLHYVLWWSRPCYHYFTDYDDFCSWVMWYMSIYIYIWINMKVFVPFMYHARIWLCLMCVVLQLVHGYTYLTIWVYDSFIDDDIVMYRIT